MDGDSKKTKSVEEEKADRIKYTQRANFYIIRKLWVVIRGKLHDGQTIHKQLGMSRPRYERLINGDATRISLQEHKRWNAMGIPDRVINGNVLIQISMLRYADWKIFFDSWDEYRKKDSAIKELEEEGIVGTTDEARKGKEEAEKERAKAEENYKEARAKVDNWITQSDKRDESKPEFFQVCQFVRNSQPRASSAELSLVVANNHVRNITPADLLEVGQRTLVEHISILEEELKMAKAVYTIRAYQHGWDDKKN